MAESPFYIRTRNGATFHVDSLEEALKEFASDEGYRLTLNAGGVEVIIRRADLPNDSEYSDVVGQNFSANVTIRKEPSSALRLVRGSTEEG